MFAGCCIPDAGYQIPDARYQFPASGIRHPAQPQRGFGHSTLRFWQAAAQQRPYCGWSGGHSRAPSASHPHLRWPWSAYLQTGTSVARQAGAAGPEAGTPGTRLDRAGRLARRPLRDCDSNLARAYLRRVERSRSHCTSLLFGCDTFKGSCRLKGGFVRESCHLWISACPSAKAKVQEPPW